MTGLIPIAAADLVPLRDYAATHPIRLDLAYADAAHPENMFGRAIYRADATIWAHRLFAPVILRAAEICHAASGFFFEIKDCLRTTEAQALMLDTDIVKANPHWILEPNRLLSPPGEGGHPRGMAVDIALTERDGGKVDMGTAFDYLTPDPAINPAARDYRDFPAHILKNRQLLESSMTQAAAELNVPLLPLPQEWWDFRFPSSFSKAYAPVSDRDLPRHMRMTEIE